MMMNILKNDPYHLLSGWLTGHLYIMKKFLLPTDFSANAKHVLNYGYALAKQIKADIIICNAIIEPAEVPQSGMVRWTMEESDVLIKDSNHELELLKTYLGGKEESIGYNPVITCKNNEGTVLNTVSKLNNHHDIDLVIIGTHGSDSLSTLLIGNHTRQLIDATDRPLLLIPPIAKILPVKKIAFATDFENPAKDLECINFLISLAKPLNAEILITNIFNDDTHSAERFVNELAEKTNYPLVYYRLVKARSTVLGLDWLCEHGQVDILAMVHRSHGFIDNLFNGSDTQKMAKHIPIPLLVFPSNS